VINNNYSWLVRHASPPKKTQVSDQECSA